MCSQINICIIIWDGGVVVGAYTLYLPLSSSELCLQTNLHITFGVGGCCGGIYSVTVSVFFSIVFTENLCITFGSDGSCGASTGSPSEMCSQTNLCITFGVGAVVGSTSYPSPSPSELCSQTHLCIIFWDGGSCMGCLICICLSLLNCVQRQIYVLPLGWWWLSQRSILYQSFFLLNCIHRQIYVLPFLQVAIDGCLLPFLLICVHIQIYASCLWAVVVVGGLLHIHLPWDSQKNLFTTFEVGVYLWGSNLYPFPSPFELCSHTNLFIKFWDGDGCLGGSTLYLSLSPSKLCFQTNLCAMFWKGWGCFGFSSIPVTVEVSKMPLH